MYSRFIDIKLCVKISWTWCVIYRHWRGENLEADDPHEESSLATGLYVQARASETSDLFSVFVMDNLDLVCRREEMPRRCRPNNSVTRDHHRLKILAGLENLL